jgi:hypothetical protein
MKRLLIGIIFATSTTVAYANCVTNTIFKRDGTMTVCTTCCYYGNCTTTCM